MNAPRITAAPIAASLGTLILALSVPAAAEDPYNISANIGAVSNYMWRGVTQTQDGAAVQGGLDFTHSSGFYLGTWASNVDFNDEGGSQPVVILADPSTASGFEEDGAGNLIGSTAGSSDPSSPKYELDFYMGFGNNITEDLSYNLKGIYYAYPDGRDSGFAEIDGSMTFKWITLGLAYTVYGENDDGLFDNGDI
ncbi:MAG: TorF family putative porin, partial [Chromatiaceae bacterium]